MEKRAFSLTKRSCSAQGIRDEVFGEGWSTLQALLVCYAAVGVPYDDDSVNLIMNLPSDARGPIAKSDWLEHYTRTVCDAGHIADDGYETDQFADRFKFEIRSALATGRGFCELSGDRDNEELVESYYNDFAQ